MMHEEIHDFTKGLMVLLLVASFWISVMCLSVGVFARPHRARCPERWHNNGIRPSGFFVCTRNPIGDPDWDGTWQRPDRSVVPAGFLVGIIYCTGGMRPIVVDDRTVGCQRE
jgi:hypothetical protein